MVKTRMGIVLDNPVQINEKDFELFLGSHFPGIEWVKKTMSVADEPIETEVDFYLLADDAFIRKAKNTEVEKLESFLSANEKFKTFTKLSKRPILMIIKRQFSDKGYDLGELEKTHIKWKHSLDGMLPVYYPSKSFLPIVEQNKIKILDIPPYNLAPSKYGFVLLDNVTNRESWKELESIVSSTMMKARKQVL